MLRFEGKKELLKLFLGGKYRTDPNKNNGFDDLRRVGFTDVIKIEFQILGLLNQKIGFFILISNFHKTLSSHLVSGFEMWIEVHPVPFLII